MKTDKQTKDDAANYVFAKRIQTSIDIKYKEPTSFGGSITASLLGGSISIEDASKDHSFTQIHGIRYRSNQYILNSLDTDGDYRPSFLDYQTYLTFNLTKHIH